MSKEIINLDEEEIWNNLLLQIGNVIYWKPEELRKRNLIPQIKSLIYFSDENLYVANEICEFLQIQKRDNRIALMACLNNFDDLQKLKDIIKTN